MAATYDFASDPEFEGLGVAVSHLTGEKVNRFTHINRGMKDLLQKQKMTRLFSQEVGAASSAAWASTPSTGAALP